MPDRARVVDLELSRPIDAIDAEVAGIKYSRAWIMLRMHRVPVGILRLEFPASGTLEPSEIEAAAQEQFGDAISAQENAARSAPVGTYPTPPITVVICTRDRPRPLERTLASLRALEYPDFRVLVVDNAPTDDATAKVVDAARDALDIDYLVIGEPGLSRARNAAIAARPGEILAWTDDDVTVDPVWLAEAGRALAAHPNASVVCGAVVPAVLDTPEQIWFEEFGGLVKGRGFIPAVFDASTRRTQSPLYPLPPFGAGANMIIRPGVLAAIGGFDNALGAGTPASAGEDTLAFTELLLRGHTIVYHPAALVHHTHRSDLTGLVAQLTGYGTGITAFYTALVLRRPWLLFRLVGMAPGALWDILARRGKRAADIPDDFPPALLRAGRRGMLRGPAAYVRGRLTQDDRSS